MKRYLRVFVAVITVLSLTGLSTNIANADVVTKRGKISYYIPTKPGSDGKTMTENDCAVDESYKYLPKGTKISVYNLDNGASKVLEKWDYGSFEKYGVVVDVLEGTFKALGGVKSAGYINKGMIQWNESLGISEIIEGNEVTEEVTE